MSLLSATPLDEGQVTAFKLFEVHAGRLRSWLGPELFERGATYSAEWSPSPERFTADPREGAPGFSAFVERGDAERWFRDDLVLVLVTVSGRLEVGPSKIDGHPQVVRGQRMAIPA